RTGQAQPSKVPWKRAERSRRSVVRTRSQCSCTTQGKRTRRCSTSRARVGRAPIHTPWGSSSALSVSVLIAGDGPVSTSSTVQGKDVEEKARPGSASMAFVRLELELRLQARTDVAQENLGRRLVVGHALPFGAHGIERRHEVLVVLALHAPLELPAPRGEWRQLHDRAPPLALAAK